MNQQSVEQARRGDREAYEQIARHVAHRLYPVAYRILRDRDLADEAVQRALVAIWRELPALRDPAKFDAWSYRLLVRFSTDELRKRQRMIDVSQLTLSPSEPAAADKIADRDQLERALRRLSPEHGAVLVLTYYRGLSGSEAAAALGVTPGTVASRLHYALRNLRAALEADARAVPAPAQPRRSGSWRVRSIGLRGAH